MTITISKERMANTMQLHAAWSHKSSANIHELQAIVGSKLFYVAQCCFPTRYCVNRMLDTLRACPPMGSVPMSQVFQKDIA